MAPMPPVAMMTASAGKVRISMERIKKLLAGGGAGKGGAVVEGASEAAEIQESLWCAIKGNSHAVEQINNAGRRLTHALHGRLVGEEVAAVNSVIKVLPGGVAF